MGNKSGIRTDGDLVRAALRIRNACAQIFDVINDLDTSTHPNAAAFQHACEENGIPVYADALLLVYRHVAHPGKIKALREIAALAANAQGNILR